MNQTQQVEQIIKYIESNDIPTSSVRAVQRIGETDYSEDHYRKALNEMTGRDLSFVSQRESKLTLMYFIAGFFRDKDTALFSINELVNVSKKKAEHFIEDNQWMVGTEDEDGNTVVNAFEEVKKIYKTCRHQHSKSEIVEMIQEAVDIKQSTLNSYLSTCKKDFGPCKGWRDEQQSRESGSTKLEDVIKAFSDRPPQTKKEAIQMIMDTVSTSKAGANTLYYAAVKTLDINIASPRSLKQSKQSKATEIVKRLHDTLDKQQILDTIIQDTGTTIAGANTYYRNAIKEIS